MTQVRRPVQMNQKKQLDKNMDLLRQKAEQRYNSLPTHVREFLMSEETANVVWAIGGAHHLDEERIEKVAQIIGNVILGVVPHERLQKEIQSATGIDARLVGELSEELDAKILSLVMPELKDLHKQPVVHSSREQNPSDDEIQVQETQQGLEESLLSPAFREKRFNTIPVDEAAKESVPERIPEPPPTPAIPPPPPPLPQQVQPQPETDLPAPPQSAESKPFVLHEETEIESVSHEGPPSMNRPQFFKSTTGEKYQAPPTTARLEIGDEVIETETQKASQTKKEEPRVVNYTGPITEIDPFVKPQPKVSEEKEVQLKQEEKKQEPGSPPEVSPDNIINLKDLPK